MLSLSGAAQRSALNTKSTHTMYSEYSQTDIYGLYEIFAGVVKRYCIVLDTLRIWYYMYLVSVEYVEVA